MVNNHDFLDVAQDLDTRKSPNYIWWTRPPSTIADDKNLIMAQLEEVVGTASSITASNDSDPGAGAHRGVLVLEHVLNVVLIGSLEVERDVRVEGGVSECFRHGVRLTDLSKACKGREKRVQEMVLNKE